MTIGIYAFVTSDWKEKDYPLDLWLRHNLSIFDQIALVRYGDFEIPLTHKKITVKSIDTVPSGYEFYRRGFKEAQGLLTTDWKVLSAIDQFTEPLSRLDSADDRDVYMLKCRNLYGNLGTEIRGASPYLPRVLACVHTGSKELMHDGVVVGKWKMRPIGQFWHTNLTRNPQALSTKLLKELKTAETEGDSSVRVRESTINPQFFDYGRYNDIWKHSYLVGVGKASLPQILLENQQRFNWFNFGNEGRAIEKLYVELHNASLLYTRYRWHLKMKKEFMKNAERSYHKR